VIQKIRHKGLKKLYRDDSAAKVNPDHADKLRRILGVLDQASSPDEVDLPGFRLHPLKGEYDGFYAVQVSGNWRVIFRFEGDQVTDVDYLDYH
jgi:proteic killer suppression protein